MLTPNEAFRRFRSKLELTQKEQDDASRRQKEIRGVMNGMFEIADDFLTGSYRRWTKTKPLKEVDIFCVFQDDERTVYREGKHPSVVLSAVEKVLIDKYGRHNVHKQRRSVTVDFPDGRDEESVMGFDVVAAFTISSHYEIPDTVTQAGWTETSPKFHEQRAIDANAAFGGGAVLAGLVLGAIAAFIIDREIMNAAAYAAPAILSVFGFIHGAQLAWAAPANPCAKPKAGMGSGSSMLPRAT